MMEATLRDLTSLINILKIPYHLKDTFHPYPFTAVKYLYLVSQKKNVPKI